MAKIVQNNGRHGWYEWVQSPVNSSAYYIYSLTLSYADGKSTYHRDELITTITGRKQAENTALLLNNARGQGFGIGYHRGLEDAKG